METIYRDLRFEVLRHGGKYLLMVEGDSGLNLISQEEAEGLIRENEEQMTQKQIDEWREEVETETGIAELEEAEERGELDELLGLDTTGEASHSREGGRSEINHGSKRAGGENDRHNDI